MRLEYKTIFPRLVELELQKKTIFAWSRDFRKSYISLEDFIYRPGFYCDSESGQRDLSNDI